MLDEQEEFTYPEYLNDTKFPLLPLHAVSHMIPGTTHPDIRWSLGDNEILFEKNKKRLGKTWHYSTKQVTYIVNKNGYRAPEWDTIDWKNSVVILGCSMIFGTGVAEDETLSYYLENLLNRPVINLGYPSASNECIFNNSISVFKKFGSPAAVITAWAPLDRFLFFSKQQYNLGLWTDKEKIDGVNLRELYEYVNLNQINSQVRSYYIEKANRLFWEDKTIYFSMSYFKEVAHYMKLNKWLQHDNAARDCVHPGKDTNYHTARYIKKLLSDKGL